MPSITDYIPGYGRPYYGPSLQDPRFVDPMWTAAEAEDFYAEQYPTSSIIGKGAAFAGAIALGYAPWKRGRVWDLYARGARAIEEYSPGYVLRTFSVAPFLSQFETSVREGFFISPQMFEAEGTATKHLAEYYTSLIGERAYPGKGTTYRRVLSEGLAFREGKLFWGRGQEVALPFASAIRVSPDASAKLPASWARVVGAPVNEPEVFFGKVQPLKGFPEFRLPTVEGMPTTVVGGHTRAQAAWRHASAWGTAMVSRFNTLLRLPAQMPPFDTAFRKGQDFVEKITEKVFGKGIRPTLAVPESTGGRMMGSLLKKYGLYLPLAYMGYQTLDWMARDNPLTSGTVFEEGLTVAAGTAVTRANLLAARVAQATGLQDYREWQESLAPGSTEFSRLAAFPIMGALFGSGAAYALKVGYMAKAQMHGASAVEARAAAEKWAGEFGKNAELAKLGRFLTREEGLYRKPGKWGDLWRRIAKPVPEATGELSFKLFRKIGPVKLAAIVGGAAGLLSVLPFIPGSLIPEKRPEELEAIYSGEQEVPIRRGRWWEFGRSAFEGNRIAYFRPHWYARMRMNAKEEGIWGDDAYRLSPIQRWFQEEFTYNLEDMHYYDRPYPVTALPLEDVPFVGPLLAATVGRAIKPERIMHEDDWISGEGTLVEPPRFGERIATEVGQLPGGMPESPYSTTGIAGEQIYRLQEMIGLPGFSMMSIKEQLTGTPDWFDQTRRLESARRMFGFERSYWDLELGGLMGTTEAFRRLYPHMRRQIPLYNPLSNTMPGWLPGPGEKSPDFLHGDPYTKVPEGELRLPGRGYETRYPELEGLSPEDYPLIHRYKILADVAPYTENFKRHLHMIQKARKQDSWSEYEERIYQQTQDQLKQRKTKIEFQEYQQLTPMGGIFGDKVYYDGEDSSDLIGAINRLKAEKDVESGLFAKYFGGYWELLSHNAETVLDQMTPLSPGAKLVHQRTAIEHYERTQLYGTENAFWNHPFRDFMRPSFWLGAQAVGYEGVPSHIARRRELEEYFDVLKYVKFARLSNIAREDQNYAALREFESKKDETLFGLNPYTRNFSAVFRALPRRDRDYFNAFAGAETEEERGRILEMVPRNEKALYVARWKLAFADEVKRARKADLLSSSELDEAEAMIGDIFEDARTEGYPTTKELNAQYIETRMTGENYGDWYRRTHLLSQLTTLPGPDWVGWHPSVDLDDIKLKVIQNWGEDMHEYDLWPSRAQLLVDKPYINDEAIQPIVGGETLSRGEIHDRINQLLRTNEMGGDVFVRTVFDPAGSDSIQMQVYEQPNYNSLARRDWF